LNTLIDLMTEGWALSNSKARIRSRCRTSKTPNIVVRRKIAMKTEDRVETPLTAAFRTVERTGDCIRQTLNPDACDIRLMANPQLLLARRYAQLSALRKPAR
jgi:hypothetical protein